MRLITAILKLFSQKNWHRNSLDLSSWNASHNFFSLRFLLSHTTYTHTRWGSQNNFQSSVASSHEYLLCLRSETESSGFFVWDKRFINRKRATKFPLSFPSQDTLKYQQTSSDGRSEIEAFRMPFNCVLENRLISARRSAAPLLHRTRSSADGTAFCQNNQHLEISSLKVSNLNHQYLSCEFVLWYVGMHFCRSAIHSFVVARCSQRGRCSTFLFHSSKKRTVRYIWVRVCHIYIK